jgi:hypothetical protein
VAASVNSWRAFSDSSEDKWNKKVTLLEDLFSGTVIQSDSAYEKFIINQIVEVCKIVRNFVVIVTLIEFIKDNNTAGSIFLIGCQILVEHLL